MSVDWDEVQKVISPIRDFEDLCHRLQVSFGFPFVCAKFNFTLPQLIDYTQRLLLGDSRNRYTEYNSKLVAMMTRLIQTGVRNVLDLKERTASRKLLENFVDQSGLPAPDTIALLKYLVYWFIPGEKYLSGLVNSDSDTVSSLKLLCECGVRTNLEILEKGLRLSDVNLWLRTAGYLQQ